MWTVYAYMNDMVLGQKVRDRLGELYPDLWLPSCLEGGLSVKDGGLDLGWTGIEACERLLNGQHVDNHKLGDIEELLGIKTVSNVCNCPISQLMCGGCICNGI